MTGCLAGCTRESAQQDPISLGVIGDDEVIVRGAFDPRSGKWKSGKIRAAIVPRDHLLAGHLSVWRLAPPGIQATDLVKRLDVIPGQTLFALCGIKAGTLRAMTCGEKRALCVVDECECDKDGNKHEAHAHIAICKSLVADGMDKDNPEFEMVRTELHFRFEKGVVWSKPSDNAMEGG